MTSWAGDHLLRRREGYLPGDLRRFFATEGLPVLKIKRVSVGEVELGLLQPGEFHRLADAIAARFSEGLKC